MADQKGRLTINFSGGWATDFGPSFTAAPQGNAITVPFLVDAENVVFELDGGPHKFGGAAKLNASAVEESGTAKTFHGITDYWIQGIAGSEVQKRFAYVGTRLMKEDLDGVWDELTAGLEDNKQPCFEIFKDLLFWASTSNVDVPRYWDGLSGSTTAVSGSPPNFSVMVRHKNRMFATGNPAFPSRVYYSADLNPNDWVGAGSGSFDVDPDDGDRVTGLISHKNELIITKGPHRLSVHRLTGSSPTGTDAFARVPFVSGVGAICHNSIFRVNDDIVFASPRGVHSLAATAAYGDYVEAFLARPILTYYQDTLNHSALHTMWGVNYQSKGLAIWTVPKTSDGTAKKTMLVYDYRFQPGRWSKLDNATGYLAANCLAVMQSSTTNKHRLYAGTASGYVYELDMAARTIEPGGGYTANVRLPFLNLGSSAFLKTAEDGFLSIQPKGDYDMTFGYTCDRNAEQTVALTQTTGDTLA